MFYLKWTEINCDFMFSVLANEALPELFIQWTKSVVSVGRVCVIFNDVLGSYFQTRKGLHQGDLYCLI